MRKYWDLMAVEHTDMERFATISTILT